MANFIMPVVKFVKQKALIRGSKCQDFELLIHHLDFHLFWKKYIDNLNFIYKTRGTFTYKKRWTPFSWY